jgi:hypothetical protein
MQGQSTLCACGCGTPITRSKRYPQKRFANGHYVRRPDPPEVRFWAKVDKDGPIPAHRPELGPCWLWTAARLNAFGYGQFAWKHGDVEVAHRVAWILTNGPIPDGLLALHKCDNPPCVRPVHLFLGTHADNVHDMWTKKRASPPPRMDQRGEKSVRTKLTDSDATEIRRRYANEDIRQVDLARAYGVAQVTIGRIIRLEVFTHLD